MCNQAYLKDYFNEKEKVNSEKKKITKMNKKSKGKHGIKIFLTEIEWKTSK